MKPTIRDSEKTMSSFGRRKKTLDKGLWPTLLAVLAVGGLLVGAPSAFAADDCIQDVWTAHGNNQSLTCTANDVTLSSVSNICITAPLGDDVDQDGCQDPDAAGKLTCTAGLPFTFTADYTMPLTAQARYDLGLYIAEDGGGADGALTGQCADNVLTDDNSPTFDQKDPSPPDVCGDIDSNPNPQVFRQSLTAACTGTGDQVVLDFCTSWRQPGSNEVCDITVDADDPANWDSFPGSPSKCNCGSLAIDVFTEKATIEVTKTVAPLTVGELGGSVVYSVSVKNLAQVAAFDIVTLDDDIYGDITTTGHDGITATTCVLQQDIPAGNVAGNPYTCTFTVAMGSADAGTIVTDTVTACGTDSFGNRGICDDDPATVTYTDVQTDPSLTKNATLNQLQVDVNFAVTVTNNSTVDTLTVNTLTDDKFGAITSTHAAGGGFGQVVSTDCATGGTIPPNDGVQTNTYNCSFVGRIIQTGLHTDRVSGTATDDDLVNYADPPLGDNASVNISVTFP